jgi:cell division protein FtsI (penicillin-binding protein 3)
MSKGFASSYRIVLLAVGLFCCFGALSVRLVWLHVIDREALLGTIKKSRQQLIVETARRGDIRDARGAILATSRSTIVLGVDPSALRPGDEKKWPQLAALIGMPEMELRRIFLTKFRLSPPTPAPAASAAVQPAGLVFNFGQLTTPAPVPAAGAPATVENDDDIEVDLTPDENGRRLIQWAKLREDVSETLYSEIKKLDIKGLTTDYVYRRAYPNNQLAAHLLGFVDRQQRPASGMEAYADFYLRGQNGWRVGERDARNRELAQFRTRHVPPSDGYSVRLSVETIIQDIVEEELAFIAQKYEPLKATIIVSDPRTGWILGMANYPSYNPNEYHKVPQQEMARMKNVAVADVYEPGSVFKIVPVAAAIEERLANTGSTFDCSLTKFEHKGRTLSLPADDHHFKDPQHVSLAEVVSYSSNRGAAQLGMRVGEDKFYRYARAFGFGAKLGFPIGGEVSGLFRKLKDWDPIDITRIPIGHSISSTALQMHQAMTVIANDGVLLRPQIIKEVTDASGAVVYMFGATEIGRVVSVETARLVAQLLTGVASKNGTAPEAAIDGFEVAGKTGTTIKLMPRMLADGTTKLDYDHKHHVASFVGFFPARVATGDPQVAISVIIDDADHKAPNGVAYGGRVAAPSFKRIGERLIPILEIKPYRPPVQSVLIASNEGGRR